LEANVAPGFPKVTPRSGLTDLTAAIVNISASNLGLALLRGDNTQPAGVLRNFTVEF
jgi:hypothetical protein